MKIFPFYGQGYAANSYLLLSDDDKVAIVVDPSQPYRDMIASLPTVPKIAGILLTHAHFDHILHLAEWRAMTNAPVYVGQGDALMLCRPEENLYLRFTGQAVPVEPATGRLADGDTIPLGEEAITVLETPGHTKGSLTFLTPAGLLTGDTLFKDGDYGRTDFPGGDFSALVRSARRIFGLPGDYILYPGHGPSSTLRREAAISSLKEP